MAYIVMAYVVMAFIVMAYKVMASIVMAYIVMFVWGCSMGVWQHVHFLEEEGAGRSSEAVPEPTRLFFCPCNYGPV